MIDDRKLYGSLLNLLPKYLSDLLKHEMGKKGTTHIHVKIYAKGVFAHIDKKVKIIDNKIVGFCPFDRVSLIINIFG